MKPNGTYKTIASAKRIAQKESSNPFVIYKCDYGYGYAYIGSAMHDDLLRGELDAFKGPGSGIPAEIVG